MWQAGCERDGLPWNQTFADAVGRSLGAVLCVGFCEDASHVVRGGTIADEELFGDLAVACAGRDQAQYLYLSFRQSVRVHATPGERGVRE